MTRALMKPNVPRFPAMGRMAPLLALASGVVAQVSASTSSSANYSISPMTLDGGGGAASSAAYSVHGTFSGDSLGTSSSASYAARHGFPAIAFGLARVSGRRVFYNASAWDGSTPGPDPRDDLAIAPDKVALRPGETAGFANYTSSSAGINGLMVDIEGVGGPLTASDFSLRVGNTADPAGWTAAPVPTSVSLRPGAGTGGSTRVTLIWPDGSIRNQWMEIQVLATSRTDLDATDRFYFGNAVGETGDRPGVDARVDAIDETRTRENVRSLFFPAPLASPYDFNRDRQIDATDQILARANATGTGTPLLLITAPAPGIPGGGGSAAMLAGRPEADSGPVLRVALDSDGSLWISSMGPLPPRVRLEWSGRPIDGTWLPVPDGLRAVGAEGVRGWAIPADASPGTAQFFRLVSDPSSYEAPQNP
jgi:hypothetical protein